MQGSMGVRNGRRPWWLVATAVLVLTTATAEADETDFARDVRPILQSRCFACHGPVKQEGGLRLDTGRAIRLGGDSGPAVEAGDAASSLLVQRISAADPDDRMPPEGDAVETRQIERIVRWVREGAVSAADERPAADPREHWSFQPFDRTAIGPQSGIDRFIRQQLDAAGLRPAVRADRVTLIRRLLFDMHGLPPSPHQIQSFVADDRPAAWSELVDQVLASPRYGERWAQHWLDVVRYADTHGYEVNTPREHAWRYRDYVIRALNDDLPYDQFVFQQLAGDTVGADAATGFLVAAPVLLPGQIGKDEASIRLARQDALDEIIVGTSATFLGLTIGCARCHDHKFDPTSQRDYYAMQAFFAGVDYGDREMHDADRQNRIALAEDLKPHIAELTTKLRQFEPLAFIGRTLVIDDEDPQRVAVLGTKKEDVAYPEGGERGRRDDPGSERRVAHLGRGRASRFSNRPGTDVFSWNPNVAGRFRVWVSWSAHGDGRSTTDARYVLDVDGQLDTTGDQIEVARADQSGFANAPRGLSGDVPVWSGLLDAGCHDWHETSRLVLRSGRTNEWISADVMVLEEVGQGGPIEAPLPHLRSPVNPLGNSEHFAAVPARFVRFTTFETIDKNRHEPCIDELEVFSPAGGNLARQARPTSSGNYSETGKHQLKHINDGRYGNSHSWISSEKGGGWVQLEFDQPYTINRISWARDREGKFKDRLPVRYAIDVSLDGQQWNSVAGSRDRLPIGTPHDEIQSWLREGASRPAAAGIDVRAVAEELARLEARTRALEQPSFVYGGIFRDPDETFVLRRGDPEQPEEEIAPCVPSFFEREPLANDASDRVRRVALAQWIAHADHPLTARVMANRIWQYHFGQGLVETASDFGLNGALPTHPELLDWLAIQLIEHDWSIKHLHRLILNSETYCQSNVISAAATAIDRDCRLLWRFPSRRLEAEAIRDSMLMASGQLNFAVGGQGFDFFKSRGGLNGFPPVEQFGPDQLRRMVYAHKVRMEPVPVFGAFDCPDAGQATPARSRSTTAIQALNLLNSPFVLDQADALAERARRESGSALDRQVERVYRLTLGRAPSGVEQQASLEVARAHGLATVCRVLFNSSEFLFMP